VSADNVERPTVLLDHVEGVKVENFGQLYIDGQWVAPTGDGTRTLIDPTSEVPMIGASGAISAVLGAYLVLFPGARILSLVFLGFFYQLIEVRAVFVLGFWFALQLVDGIASLGLAGAEGGVAFFAHIGGFVAGAAIGLLVRGTLAGRGRLSGLPRAGVG